MQSDTVGVMFDTCQKALLPWFWDSGQSTPSIHLFSSDDTPTPQTDIFALTELTNSGYAPIDVPNGIEFVAAPPPGHFDLDPVSWTLHAPDPGQDTIFGWYLEGDFFAEGWGLFGGRFPTPVVIPPFGMLLKINAVSMYLHSCDGLYPAGVLFFDPFIDTNGTAVPPHAPLVGKEWIPGQGTWQIAGTAMVSSTNANGDYLTSCLSVSDYTLLASMDVQSSSGSQGDLPWLLFRWSDASNYWSIRCDGYLGAVFVWKTVAGVDHLARTIGGPLIDPFGGSPFPVAWNVEAVLLGSAINISVNGLAGIPIADSFNQTIPNFGVRLQRTGSGAITTSARWVEVMVRA